MRQVSSMKILSILGILALLLALTFTAYAAASEGRTAYSGNPRSMKYHNSGCRYFNCKACTVRLSSPADAKAKGYVACKHCGG